MRSFAVDCSSEAPDPALAFGGFRMRPSRFQALLFIPFSVLLGVGPAPSLESARTAPSSLRARRSASEDDASPDRLGDYIPVRDRRGGRGAT